MNFELVIRRVVGALEAAGGQGRASDWPLLTDDLEIFHVKARLSELTGYYGKAE